eukprot:SAG11_NODE_3857_length_2189_cov_4.381340_3_plen_76_part_00
MLATLPQAVGPRLHALLGAKRFVALYLCGALGGSVARTSGFTAFQPRTDEEAVLATEERYHNILKGVGGHSSHCL